MVPWLYYSDPIEGVDPYTGQPIEPSVWLDISDVFDRKMGMLACHASQREWLRAHHGIDEYIEAMKRHGARRGQEARHDLCRSLRATSGASVSAEGLVGCDVGRALGMGRPFHPVSGRTRKTLDPMGRGGHSGGTRHDTLPLG